MSTTAHRESDTVKDVLRPAPPTPQTRTDRHAHTHTPGTLFVPFRRKNNGNETVLWSVWDSR